MLLSKVFNLAEAWGLRQDRTNPCSRVKRFPENKRRRYLSPAELARLGGALRIAERGELRGASWQTIAFVWFAILTGMRSGEVKGLRWDNVDVLRGVATLPSTKSGFREVQLAAPALEVLAGLPRLEGSPFVLPAAKGDGHFVGTFKGWDAIRKAAGIEDVHAHDLRHSFASVGAGGGASLPIIGALLGHSNPSTTARYAHLADDPLRAASDAIGERISAALEGDAAPVLQLGRVR